LRKHRLRVCATADSAIMNENTKQITLNGEKRGTSAANVAELVAQLELKGDRIAVEQNLEIVPRASWSESQVRDGDRFEIVHFVGGG
jgi:thiamine biosynthesis protein ThiS